MEKATPLINSSMLPSYSGQIVRVVGKVHKISGDRLLLQTSDMGNVEVKLSKDSELSRTGFLEILGKVADNGDGMTEFTCTDFGEKLDLNLVESCIQVQQQVPELFTEAG